MHPITERHDGIQETTARQGQGPMHRHLVAAIVPLVFALSACRPNPDENLWECEFQVQKENAGRSPEAMAEKASSIENCMNQRGFRFDAGKRGCPTGTVSATCYVPR